MGLCNQGTHSESPKPQAIEDSSITMGRMPETKEDVGESEQLLPPTFLKPNHPNISTSNIFGAVPNCKYWFLHWTSTHFPLHSSTFPCSPQLDAGSEPPEPLMINNERNLPSMVRTKWTKHPIDGPGPDPKKHQTNPIMLQGATIPFTGLSISMIPIPGTLTIYTARPSTVPKPRALIPIPGPSKTPTTKSSMMVQPKPKAKPKWSAKA